MGGEDTHIKLHSLTNININIIIIFISMHESIKIINH